MIITKLDKDTYQIKLPEKNIDIYNPKEIKDIIEKITKKILKKEKLYGIAIIEIFEDINYGTIIEIKNIKKIYYPQNELEVKITIHTGTTFLYKIDYFDIKKSTNNKIYYYQNNFYLEINKHINKKKYLNILEKSEIIYNDTYQIINNGLKIKV